MRERLGRYEAETPFPAVRVVLYCRPETIAIARPLAQACYIELEPYHNADGKGGEIDVRPSDVVLGNSSLVRLPFVFGQMGMDDPYIAADASDSAAWGAALNRPFGGRRVMKVGICHQAAQYKIGNKTFTPAEDRICPVRHFQRLVDHFRGRVAFFLLTPRKEPGPPRIVGAFDPGEHLRSWQQTAAAISVLDLTISVDTALCHVVGGMGRPVWTLVPHSSCWRWGMHPERTPWYPSMNLYRHRQVGDWKGAMERVITDLEAVLSRPV